MEVFQKDNIYHVYYIESTKAIKIIRVENQIYSKEVRHYILIPIKLIEYINYQQLSRKSNIRKILRNENKRLSVWPNNWFQCRVFWKLKKIKIEI